MIQWYISLQSLKTLYLIELAWVANPKIRIKRAKSHRFGFVVANGE